jgi:hypothetical protein
VCVRACVCVCVCLERREIERGVYNYAEGHRDIPRIPQDMCAYLQVYIYTVIEREVYRIT